MCRCGGLLHILIGHQYKVACCSEVRANLRTDAHGTPGHHGNALLRNGFLIHELPLIQQKKCFIQSGDVAII
jgi:hypothetical protein